MEEHTECKCACALTPADCQPASQFGAADCACRCADTAARSACLDQPGRLWDDNGCACTCALHSADCLSASARLDPATCTCQQEEEGGLVEVVSRRQEVVLLSTAPFLSLEVLLIVFLVSLVLVLGLLFLCLACKLRRMQKEGSIGACGGGGGRSPLVPSTLSGIGWQFRLNNSVMDPSYQPDPRYDRHSYRNPTVGLFR